MSKYERKAAHTIEKVLHEFKEGDLTTGGGTKVRSRKQAVAIALSEARKQGATLPARRRGGA